MYGALIKRRSSAPKNTLARVIFPTFINDFKKNPLSISRFQLGQRLDDLLELLCTDIKADTVEEAESALRTLAEKVDTICKYFCTIILYTLFIFLFALTKN